MNLIFDLDGTLIDPFEGVSKSFRYALTALGVDTAIIDDSGWFVGPPLRETLRPLLKGDEDLVEQAIALYRERFQELGVHECKVYDHVHNTLAWLAERHALFIATARIQRFADLICDIHNITPYFTAIYGTHPTGFGEDKAELVRHIISERNLNPDETLLVGDRRFDIIAARENAIRSIAILHGYGPREELDREKPSYLVEEMKELIGLIESLSATP